MRWGDRVTFVISVGVVCGWIPAVQAQIRPDDTLSTPSRVDERRPGRFVIREGTRRDRLLFHSFREFSVPNRGEASFRGIDPAVDLILMRVTGNAASSINGAIEILQENGRLSNADVFLLNPNGIVFGRNASLRLGGSFLATTAESFRFEDGTVFSAANPQDAPILNVNVPIGLQFGQRPGSIENASLVDATGDRFIDGLTVLPRQTLALVGGNLLFSGGAATAPSGRMELGSIGEDGFIAIAPTASGFQLDYSETSTFQNIRFEGFATVVVDGDGSAGLQIQGDEVVLADASLYLPPPSE
ncbi:MAG: filamentous hemagglutinin N-terminal domain-containing protein [Synechococcales cyanobacterium T60_A2020_003]|nr:filamentous hemagglutinin N-terminal domain-containing protein [Synechococcales cyanobacterium T60_A2020_003]